MAETVRIANPLPGGSTYTSVKQARRFVDRGIGVIQDGVLVLHEDRQFSNCLFDFKVAQDKGIEERARREGMIWWNGCKSPRAMMPPFCNVSIPRPDAMRQAHLRHRPVYKQLAGLSATD